MIKKNLKTLIITSVIILIPIIIGLCLWNQLPEKIPFHWNVKGEVDDWASKPVAVFALPLFMLAMQWVCVFATSSDPKKQNITPKAMLLALWIVPVLSVVLSLVMYLSALGTEVRIEIVMTTLLGLMFVIIGNYMPKCKQTYTIGFRISWTLNNEQNWNKTHRLAGWLWVGGGIVILITGFFGLWWPILPCAAIMALVPIVYSFVLHKRGL